MDHNVGTSGYQYHHWRGAFYPESIAQREWLGFYAERFDTLELNSTFYRLPSVDTVREWVEQVPNRFRFAAKFSRYGSHMKRLRDPEKSLDPFRKIVRAFGDRLGVVLLQLPPRWRANPERLDAFLEAAPDIRWAVEFRDGDWYRSEVMSVLERHNAALCVHDGVPADQWRVTAEHTYVRFHGSENAESFGARRAKRWAEWLENRADRDGTREAWVYFNNDGDAHAPHDADAFRNRLGHAG